MRRTVVLCGVVVLSLQLAACGPTYKGRVYEGAGMHFATGEVPAGWRRIETRGALITFRDDAAGATVAVNGRCGRDAGDVPLEALTQHLFLMFTDRQISEQKKVQLDGREALRTQMTARLDGVMKGFIVYVLKKDGCVYDFVYITQVQGLQAEAEKFDRFVAGFRALRDEVVED